MLASCNHGAFYYAARLLVLTCYYFISCKNYLSNYQKESQYIMKIEKVTLLKLTLSLKHPYLNLKEGYVTHKRSLLCKVVLADEHETTGWGEAVENVLLTGADLNALSADAQRLAHKIVKQETGGALQALGKEKVSPSKYGLETALIDAICRSRGLSIADYFDLSGRQTELINDAALPVMDAETMLEDTTELYLLDDYDRIKYQIKPAASEIERILRLPFLLPDRVRVCLELTKPWTSKEEAKKNLQRLADSKLKIDYVQLPIGAPVPSTSIPLAMPVNNLDDAKQAAANKVMFNINLLKCGGPVMAVKIANYASSRDLSCIISGAGENVIGMTIAARLAAGLPNVKYVDLPGLDRVKAGPVMGGAMLNKGKLLVPPAAGLGLSVNESSDQLDLLTEVFH